MQGIQNRPTFSLKALYSCCNLDNSVPAETVWSILSLQLCHIQVAAHGNRKGSAQLGFYCQNSFPAWLANNKRWQNTFYHLWWPNLYIPPSRVTDLRVWFLLLGSGFSGKVKPSPHIECSSSSLTGTNFESSWGSTLSTCSCLPFNSSHTDTVKCLTSTQQPYLISFNCFCINNCIVHLLDN